MGTAVWAALSNTSCECVVAKANEADCFANAEVQCPKGRGDVALKYFPNTLIEDEQTLVNYLRRWCFSESRRARRPL